MTEEMTRQGPFAEYLGHFDGLVDAEHLTAALCQRGVAQLAESETEELWLIADPSDLRKPYASEMPDLMQVKDLDGKLVPGYRTLHVLEVTPGRRGILYHRLFSSVAEDFEGEPLEVQRGLKKVSQAVRPLKERMAVSWIVDHGFDDVAVWRTIWEQEEHVVCRISHTGRIVEYQTIDGKLTEGDVVAVQRASWDGWRYGGLFRKSTSREPTATGGDDTRIGARAGRAVSPD